MHQPRILVVDDDRLMLTLLLGVLRGEGFTAVDKASNGKEAMIRFLQQRPEIIFLDIEMPAPDGIETLKAIKSYGIVTEVVMMAVTPTAQVVLAAMEAGAAGFLVKPVSPKKVADAVAACLVHARKGEGGVEHFVSK